MKTYFVDTNVFLRYITNDNEKQADAVENLFKRAIQGKLELQTSVMVIAEIVWTLASYYKLPREQIKENILAIMNTPGLSVENAELIMSAILIYEDKNIDFIDAYNACWMKQKAIQDVYTFDIKHFARVTGIEPTEP